MGPAFDPAEGCHIRETPLTPCIPVIDVEVMLAVAEHKRELDWLLAGSLVYLISLSMDCEACHNKSLCKSGSFVYLSLLLRSVFINFTLLPLAREITSEGKEVYSMRLCLLVNR